MRLLRWILLALYVALVIGLGVLALLPKGGVGTVIVFAVAVIGLAVFILGAGHKDLFRPIRRPRLVLPVVAAAFMMAVLVAGLTLALAELCMMEKLSGSEVVFWVCMGASWIFWSVLLYVYTRKLDRYGAIYRLSKTVFAGSLAELLATVPSHLVVQRRGGCFVGIHTAIGILAGLCVMLWSFGPGIFMLFLAEARRRQEGRKPAPDGPAASRRARFQFQIRTLLLVTLALSVIAALLKTFWGNWFATAFAATLVLFLLGMLLGRQSILLILAGLAVLAGLFWVFRDEWMEIALLVFAGIPLFAASLWFFARAPNGHRPSPPPPDSP